MALEVTNAMHVEPTYESVELLNPVSKMNPDAPIEIRDTDHLFYRLDAFQEVLEQHAANQQGSWKSNVRAMTKTMARHGIEASCSHA